MCVNEKHCDPAILIMNKEHELHEWSNITNEKIIYRDISFRITEAVLFVFIRII
jgi:hypothetical protein